MRMREANWRCWATLSATSLRAASLSSEFVASEVVREGTFVSGSIVMVGPSGVSDVALDSSSDGVMAEARGEGGGREEVDPRIEGGVDMGEGMS